MSHRKRQAEVLVILAVIAVAVWFFQQPETSGEPPPKKVTTEKTAAPQETVPETTVARFDPSGPPLTVSGVQLGDTRSHVMDQNSQTEPTLDRPYELEWDLGRDGLRRIHFSDKERVSFALGTQLEQGDAVLVQPGDTENAVLSVLGQPESTKMEDTLPGYRVLRYRVPEELEIVLYHGRVASDKATSGVVSGAIHLRSSDWVHPSRLNP